MRLLIKWAVGWYLLLLTVHYFNQRPLWNDEALVLDSVRNLHNGLLFAQPLESHQAFPRLYLWLIQQFSRPFDYHVLALRFFPFAAMAAAFLLWVQIAHRRWGDSPAMLTFCLCWTASVPLIYYGAELKQYSVDVLAAALITTILIACAQRRLSYVFFLCIPFLGFFSYAALFLMLIPLYQLARLTPKDAQARRILTPFAGLYFVVLACLYYFDWRVSIPKLLEIYWHDYFISFSSIGDFFKTLGEGINNLISRWFVEKPKFFRAGARVFIGFGFGYLLWVWWRTLKLDRYCIQSVVTIAGAVFFELLLLGALRLFPFTVPRMSLFFAPLLLFATVEGFEHLRRRWPAAYGPVQGIFWVYLAGISLGISREVIISGDLGAQSPIWQ